MKNVIWHYQEVKCTLKSEKCTEFPHLFHGPLDNEPPPACLQTSRPSPMLNKEQGFGEWMMPGGIA